MLDAILKNKTNNTLIQLIRYTFVGGFAFTVDFGTLYVLTEFFNVYYLVSAAIAFTIGLLINYTLSVIWVFDKRAVQNKWLEFAIFAAIGMVGLALNELFMWFFTEVVGLYYMLSKMISTGFVYLWNFIVRKITLFR
ncbi:MAG: GtrA family protein [Gammaproteobacteria bacterium]|nr:GtrA family protein [Gammaproteobacteria bacterium]MDH5799221.1 GtrA family protein [Gammaproteobacteria bacterium]